MRARRDTAEDETLDDSFAFIPPEEPPLVSRNTCTPAYLHFVYIYVTKACLVRTPCLDSRRDDTPQSSKCTYVYYGGFFRARNFKAAWLEIGRTCIFAVCCSKTTSPSRPCHRDA